MNTANDNAQPENGLPAGWVWTTLGEVADLIGGGTPTREVPEYFTGDIVWLTPTEIPKVGVTVVRDSKERITEEALRRSSARLVPEGSVLMTSRASIGYVAVAGTDLTTNQGFASFVPREGVYNLYLAHWLRANTELFLQYATGTTFKEITKSKLRPLVFPLAPLPEQHRIVAEIETQFSRLDAGVAALKRAQGNLRRYKASVLKAACEGRLVPTEAELARAEGRAYESGSALLARILAERRARWEQANPGKRYVEPKAPAVDGLAELPEGWVWARVGQICELGTGATPLRSKAKYWDDGTIPWITSGALNDLWIDHATQYITEIAVQETNVKIFPKGTLLVAMYGEGKTRGKVSELRLDATTNQACAALITSGVSRDVKAYLKLFLQGNYEDIRRLSSGGVQPNLNLSIVRDTLFPLPPLAEQHRIVSEVERRLSVVQEVEGVVAAGLRRAERLRQSILKQAFAGRLATHGKGVGN